MSAVALALWTLCAHAAPPPPPVQLTAAEEAQLAAGEVTVRYGGDAAQTLAVVDVAAPPPTVMKAVMDLPARVSDIGSLSGVEVYHRSGDDVSAKWTMSIAMVNVTFHIQYDCDMGQGWCEYTLDPTRENDVDSAKGSYQAYAHGTGTRLVYRTDAIAAGAPEWVRKKLSGSSAREMLGGMKTRAER